MRQTINYRKNPHLVYKDTCIGDRGVRTNCGRVRLQTQIRRNYRIRGLTADGCFWEHCGLGL